MSPTPSPVESTTPTAGAAESGELALRALRTDCRCDARGEYILRLTSEQRSRLGLKSDPGVVQHVRVSGSRTVPGDRRGARFEVLASVRGWHDGDEIMQASRLAPEGRQGMACIDQTLRDAIGATAVPLGLGHPQLPPPPEVESERIVVRPLLRELHTGWWARRLQFRWVVCRARMAFAGDMETPVCRVATATLESLGLPGGGIVVLESPHGSVRRRVLPIDDDQRALLAQHGDESGEADGSRKTDDGGASPDPRRVDEATRYDELSAASDFDGFLGLAPVRAMPSIFVDFDTRQELDIAAGQPVWVRREGPALGRSAWNRFAPAFLLTLLGMIVSVRECIDDFRSGEARFAAMAVWGLIAVAGGVLLAMSFAFALAELVDGVRVQTESPCRRRDAPTRRPGS